MAIRNNRLIKKLLSLELPEGEYVVMGSGPMYAHGIKNELHDLDVLARGPAWERVKHLHKMTKSAYGDAEVSVFLGDIEIFNVWEPGEWNEDKIIDEAEMIEGIPFAKLEYVLEYKKRMNREKDKKDIKVLEEYLGKTQDRKR